MSRDNPAHHVPLVVELDASHPNPFFRISLSDLGFAQKLRFHAKQFESGKGLALNRLQEG